MRMLNHKCIHVVSNCAVCVEKQWGIIYIQQELYSCYVNNFIHAEVKLMLNIYTCSRINNFTAGHRPRLAKSSDLCSNLTAAKIKVSWKCSKQTALAAIFDTAINHYLYVYPYLRSIYIPIHNMNVGSSCGDIYLLRESDHDHEYNYTCWLVKQLGAVGQLFYSEVDNMHNGIELGLTLYIYIGVIIYL